MNELGASNLDGAAQRVNPVTPIKLQPAQMQTGYTHWMGELDRVIKEINQKQKIR